MTESMSFVMVVVVQMAAKVAATIGHPKEGSLLIPRHPIDRAVHARRGR